MISRPRPQAVDRAAVDRLRELAGRVGELVIGVRALPVDFDVLEARAADPCDSARRRRQHGVAHGLALQPPRVGPPEQPVLGVDALGRGRLATCDACRYAAEVTIRRCIP